MVRKCKIKTFNYDSKLHLNLSPSLSIIYKKYHNIVQYKAPCIVISRNNCICARMVGRPNYLELTILN